MLLHKARTGAVYSANMEFRTLVFKRQVVKSDTETLHGKFETINK